MEQDDATRPRIRELREERGWTQEETAEQLHKLAYMRDRTHVGVNADMVAKWERGDKRPSRMYRDLLCLLFGVTAEYLRLGPARAGKHTVAERPVPANADDSLVTALGGAAAILDQLGTAGAILQPRIFEAWKDDVMQRRALLQLIGISPVMANLSSAPGNTGHRQVSKATPETVRDLDDLAGRYQTLYHSTAPAALMTPVVAHLRTVGDLLTRGPASAERRRLLANRSRVATLAGRLAFFDFQDPMTARGYYNLSLEAAREAGDHLQAAAALGHVAFIPAAEMGFSAALDYLTGAAHHVTKHPHAPVSSWLAAVESEMHTNAGSYSAALAAIDRAREALSGPEPAHEPPWFDYYDPTRLAGFAGYASLRAGRLDDAAASLDDAVQRLPRLAVKQRAVFLADMATVKLRSGDLDHACHIAGDAAEQLHQAGYATGAERLREFRAEVNPWKTSIPVRALDDQLALLA